ncbi:restriction endonuclease [Deinococcus sp. QL22]|uniref:restriction endonuclease n=1 Tax=Deinococcus sp. QL22 TaxID=2939437 RepID=UPI0020178A72|nr:restriction endonuclease [Deinococcus sp. QL22]UQN08031.1 restriction endonuclease [Deinococcus sp. QL22]
MARRRRRQQPLPPLAVLLLFLGGLTVLGWYTFPALMVGVWALGLGVTVWVQWHAATRRKARTLALHDLHSLSHRQFELHVAAVIAALPGWQAEATRGSNDQGADVIAISPKRARVAIQVKHYPTNTVGNKAVQEIVASKAMYRCSEAVVVTSGPGYTRAAVELARANGVKLWGPDDLFRLQTQALASQAAPRELLPA